MGDSAGDTPDGALECAGLSLRGERMGRRLRVRTSADAPACHAEPGGMRGVLGFCAASPAAAAAEDCATCGAALLAAPDDVAVAPLADIARSSGRAVDGCADEPLQLEANIGCCAGVRLISTCAGGTTSEACLGKAYGSSASAPDRLVAVEPNIVVPDCTTSSAGTATASAELNQYSPATGGVASAAAAAPGAADTEAPAAGGCGARVGSKNPAPAELEDVKGMLGRGSNLCNALLTFESREDATVGSD
jgi:hypothetical protein